MEFSMSFYTIDKKDMPINILTRQFSAEPSVKMYVKHSEIGHLKSNHVNVGKLPQKYIIIYRDCRDTYTYLFQNRYISIKKLHRFTRIR